MEPSESQTILCGEISTHNIEGISDGFVPGIFARHSELVDSMLSVSSEEAIDEMRRLARGHGLLFGPRSGAPLIAASRVRDTHPDFDAVVPLVSARSHERRAGQDGVRRFKSRRGPGYY